MDKHQLETMFQDSDEMDFCETCLKKGCTRIELGRRWCVGCWQAFQVEYNTWLDSTSKEVSSGA